MTSTPSNALANSLVFILSRRTCAVSLEEMVAPVLSLMWSM